MKCPVCSARFRGARECSRCGADLKAVMLITARAWRLREDARRALASGDWAAAREIAGEAWNAEANPQAASLLRLSALLSQIQGGDSGGSSLSGRSD